MIRKYLVAGFFTLLPSIVTLWALRAIFDTLVNIFDGPTKWLSPVLGLSTPEYWQLAVASGLVTLLLLLLVGVLVSNFIGAQILSWLDKLVMHIPIVRAIYGATKQLMSSIQNGQGSNFKEVVMVEWPHPGSYTLGFIANKNCKWTKLPKSNELIAVYIPTAPNPTSGYIIILNGSKIIPTNIAPEEALTWAISGGVVGPKEHQQTNISNF